jgi:adenosylhomocysteine nucleosidase
LPARNIAIVAALDREISSLVKTWHPCVQQHSGHTFRFFESENAVAVCGGIGAEAARRAAEAIIHLYSPALIYSAGFAGAADAKSKIGDIVIPRRVIDARDGSSVDTGTGGGILVSFVSVASPQQKAKLRDAFNAGAVDMEAAAVAKAASARGIRFAAVKAISDQHDFVLPPLDKFVAADGTFNTVSFVLFVFPRPWLWRDVVRLQRNSAKAARALCECLLAIVTETVKPAQSAENAVKVINR